MTQTAVPLTPQPRQALALGAAKSVLGTGGVVRVQSPRWLVLGACLPTVGFQGGVSHGSRPNEHTSLGHWCCISSPQKSASLA